jgi:hypothetical protein
MKASVVCFFHSLSTKRDISGSHGGKYEEDNLLGYCTLMMEAVNTSETSIYFYKITQCNIAEGCHLSTKPLKHYLGKIYSL